MIQDSILPTDCTFGVNVSLYTENLSTPKDPYNVIFLYFSITFLWYRQSWLTVEDSVLGAWFRDYLRFYINQFSYAIDETILHIKTYKLCSIRKRN